MYGQTYPGDDNEAIVQTKRLGLEHASPQPGGDEDRGENGQDDDDDDVFRRLVTGVVHGSRIADREDPESKTQQDLLGTGCWGA